MSEILKKIENSILFTGIFLVPLVFTSMFPSSFITPKIIIAGLCISLVLLLKAIRTIVKGDISFTTGTFDFPVFLFAVSYILSTILRTPNKMEALFLPGSASIVIIGALFYFTVQQLTKAEKGIIPAVLIASGVTSSFFVLLSSLQIFKSIPQLPQFMKDPGFSPIGGALGAFIFLLTIAPFCIQLFMKEKDIAYKAIWGVCGFMMLFGITLSGISILPGKPTTPQLPNFNTSWSVAIDSLKVSPLLGVGPGNYLTAFNRFRPVEYNQSEIWRVRFNSANSLYLTIITEAGILAITAVVLLSILIVNMIKKHAKDHLLDGALAALLILALISAFTPGNVVTMMLIFVLFALVSETKSTNLKMAESHGDAKTRIPAIVVTLPLIVAVLFVWWKSLPVIRAEGLYMDSLQAISTNNGKEAYDKLRETIIINPYADRYRTSYAQLNLVLANSIAAKKDLSDEERNTIAQLIQQAIREGKATVALNPQRSGNWEVLAQVYQTIIPLAKDGRDFAIQTYRQAIALDPINPELRVGLGGIYYAAKNYDEAIKFFELATFAKQDFANSHFNLAYALREKGDLERAIQEMTVVMSLVDKNSQDYVTAKKALEDMEAKKKTLPTTEKTDTLTPPQQEQQGLNPPLELPNDSEPPTPAVNPTPTPNPTGNPLTSPAPTNNP